MDSEPASNAGAAPSPSPSPAKGKNSTESPIRAEDDFEQGMVEGAKGQGNQEAADVGEQAAENEEYYEDADGEYYDEQGGEVYEEEYEAGPGSGKAPPLDSAFVEGGGDVQDGGEEGEYYEEGAYAEGDEYYEEEYTGEGEVQGSGPGEVEFQGEQEETAQQPVTGELQDPEYQEGEYQEGEYPEEYDEGEYQEEYYEEGQEGQEGEYLEGGNEPGVFQEGEYTEEGEYNEGQQPEGEYKEGQVQDGEYLEEGEYEEGQYAEGDYEEGYYEEGPYEEGAYEEEGVNQEEGNHEVPATASSDVETMEVDGDISKDTGADVGRGIGPDEAVQAEVAGTPASPEPAEMVTPDEADPTPVTVPLGSGGNEAPTSVLVTAPTSWAEPSSREEASADASAEASSEALPPSEAVSSEAALAKGLHEEAPESAPVATTLGETPSVGAPSEDTAIAEAPESAPVATTLGETPSEGIPSEDTAITETPRLGLPSEDTAMAEAPESAPVATTLGETPSVEAPSEDTPIAEAPSLETPSAEPRVVTPPEAQPMDVTPVPGVGSSSAAAALGAVPASKDAGRGPKHWDTVREVVMSGSEKREEGAGEEAGSQREEVGGHPMDVTPVASEGSSSAAAAVPAGKDVGRGPKHWGTVREVVMSGSETREEGAGEENGSQGEEVGGQWEGPGESPIDVSGQTEGAPVVDGSGQTEGAPVIDGSGQTEDEPVIDGSGHIEGEGRQGDGHWDRVREAVLNSGEGSAPAHTEGEWPATRETQVEREGGSGAEMGRPQQEQGEEQGEGDELFEDAEDVGADTGAGGEIIGAGGGVPGVAASKEIWERLERARQSSPGFPSSGSLGRTAAPESGEGDPPTDGGAPLQEQGGTPESGGVPGENPSSALGEQHQAGAGGAGSVSSPSPSRSGLSRIGSSDGSGAPGAPGAGSSPSAAGALRPLSPGGTSLSPLAPRPPQPARTMSLGLRGRDLQAMLKGMGGAGGGSGSPGSGSASLGEEGEGEGNGPGGGRGVGGAGGAPLAHRSRSEPLEDNDTSSAGFEKMGTLRGGGSLGAPGSRRLLVPLRRPSRTMSLAAGGFGSIDLGTVTLVASASGASAGSSGDDSAHDTGGLPVASRLPDLSKPSVHSHLFATDLNSSGGEGSGGSGGGSQGGLVPQPSPRRTSSLSPQEGARALLGVGTSGNTPGTPSIQSGETKGDREGWRLGGGSGSGSGRKGRRKGHTRGSSPSGGEGEDAESEVEDLSMDEDSGGSRSHRGKRGHGRRSSLQRMGSGVPLLGGHSGSHYTGGQGGTPPEGKEGGSTGSGPPGSAPGVGAQRPLRSSSLGPRAWGKHLADMQELQSLREEIEGVVETPEEALHGNGSASKQKRKQAPTSRDPSPRKVMDVTPGSAIHLTPSNGQDESPGSILDSTPGSDASLTPGVEKGKEKEDGTGDVEVDEISAAVLETWRLPSIGPRAPRGFTLRKDSEERERQRGREQGEGGEGTPTSKEGTPTGAAHRGSVGRDDGTPLPSFVLPEGASEGDDQGGVEEMEDVPMSDGEAEGEAGAAMDVEGGEGGTPGASGQGQGSILNQGKGGQGSATPSSEGYALGTPEASRGVPSPAALEEERTPAMGIRPRQLSGSEGWKRKEEAALGASPSPGYSTGSTPGSTLGSLPREMSDPSLRHYQRGPPSDQASPGVAPGSAGLSPEAAAGTPPGATTQGQRGLGGAPGGIQSAGASPVESPGAPGVHRRSSPVSGAPGQRPSTGEAPGGGGRTMQGQTPGAPASSQEVRGQGQAGGPPRVRGSSLDGLPSGERGLPPSAQPQALEQQQRHPEQQGPQKDGEQQGPGHAKPGNIRSNGHSDTAAWYSDTKLAAVPEHGHASDQGPVPGPGSGPPLARRRGQGKAHQGSPVEGLDLTRGAGVGRTIAPPQGELEGGGYTDGAAVGEEEYEGEEGADAMWSRLRSQERQTPQDRDWRVHPGHTGESPGRQPLQERRGHQGHDVGPLGPSQVQQAGPGYTRGVGGKVEAQQERRQLFVSPLSGAVQAVNGEPEDRKQYQHPYHQQYGQPYQQQYQGPHQYQQQYQQYQQQYLPPYPPSPPPSPPPVARQPSPAEKLTPECLKALVAKLDNPTDWLTFGQVSRAWGAAAAQGPERLRLERGGHLSARGLQRALLNCPRVTDLSVPCASLDSPVSDDLLCTVGYTCPSLTRIVLAADPALPCAFSSLGLDALFSGCPSLEQVTLEGHFGAAFTGPVAPKPQPRHGVSPWGGSAASPREAGGPDEPNAGTEGLTLGAGEASTGGAAVAVVPGSAGEMVEMKGQGQVDGKDGVGEASSRVAEALRVEKERAVRAVSAILAAIRKHSGSLVEEKWADKMQETLRENLDHGLEVVIEELERRLPAVHRRYKEVQRAVERELQRFEDAVDSGLDSLQEDLERRMPAVHRLRSLRFRHMMAGIRARARRMDTPRSTAESAGGGMVSPWEGTIIGGDLGSDLEAPGSSNGFPSAGGEPEAGLSGSGVPGGILGVSAGSFGALGGSKGVGGGVLGRQRRVALYSIPPSLGTLGKLTSLTLKFVNEPTQIRIPEEMGRLTSLTHLHLGFSQPPIVPASLWALEGLQHLELSGWKGLALLPNCMGDLRSLETMKLQCADLLDVPPSLSLLESLTKLEWEPPRRAPGVFAKLPPPPPPAAVPSPAPASANTSGPSAEPGMRSAHQAAQSPAQGRVLSTILSTVQTVQATVQAAVQPSPRQSSAQPGVLNLSPVTGPQPASKEASPPPAEGAGAPRGSISEARSDTGSDAHSDGVTNDEGQSDPQTPTRELQGSGGSGTRVEEPDTIGTPGGDIGTPESPSTPGPTTDVSLDDPRDDEDAAPDAEADASSAHVSPPGAPAQSPAVQVASAVATGVAAAAATVAATAVAGAIAGAGLIRDQVPWDSLLSAYPVPGWGGTGVGSTRGTPGGTPGVVVGGAHLAHPEQLFPHGEREDGAGGGLDGTTSWLLADNVGVPASLPALTALRHLSLRNVSRLPEQTSQYPPNLTALRVWGPQGAHRLTYIPNALIHLKKLEDLEIRGEFPCVPAGLGTLRSLKRLVLISPRIDCLPLSTSNLVSLTELRVDGCSCGPFKLPDALFASLPKLKILSLPSMPGAVIPGSICQLAYLTYLSIEQPLAFSGPQPPPSPSRSPTSAPQGTPPANPSLSLLDGPLTPASPLPSTSLQGTHTGNAMGTPGAGVQGGQAQAHPEGMIGSPAPAGPVSGREGGGSPAPLGREQTTQPRLVDTVLGPWSFVSAKERPWAFAKERLQTLGAALGAPGVYSGTDAGNGTGTGAGAGTGSVEQRNGVISQSSADGGKLSNAVGVGGGGRNGVVDGREMEFHPIPVPLFSPSPSRFSSSDACLPSTLGSLASLETFRLRCPHITMLPRTFVSLPSLTDLELQFSGPLPRDFGQLVALKRLVLDSPAVYTLPESFGELTALTDLTLSCPGMVILPNSFGCLSRLSNLTFLQCHSLSALPPSFGALSGLKKLELRCKALARLPRSFCFLKSLRELALESRVLTELPENFGMLTTLRSLHLNCPLLQRLPGTFSNLPPDVLMQVSTDLLGLSLHT